MGPQLLQEDAVSLAALPLSNRWLHCVTGVLQATALCSPLPPPIEIFILLGWEMLEAFWCKQPGHTQQGWGTTLCQRVLTWPAVAQLLSLCWFCFREVLGVDALWPVLMAVNALPALFQLLTLPFFPDSPRYLLIDKKDKEGCIKGKEIVFWHWNHLQLKWKTASSVLILVLSWH